MERSAARNRVIELREVGEPWLRDGGFGPNALLDVVVERVRPPLTRPDLPARGQGVLDRPPSGFPRNLSSSSPATSPSLSIRIAARSWSPLSSVA